MARIIAERMRAALGQPIIIENIGGADGSLGAGRAARARPDGYTIDVGFISNHVLNAALYSLPYDVLNDFVPIAPLTTVTFALFARKTLPPNDLTELVAWLKANLGKASMGVVTSSYRLLSVSFQKETGAQFTLVPYRGVAPTRQDLVAGQIDLAWDVLDAMTLVRAGSIKAFAVVSDRRAAAAADIPTFAEMGLPGVSYTSWYGLFAPRGTPKEIVGRLNAAAVEALADPAVRSQIADLRLEVFPPEQQTPEALGALVRAGAEKWWPIIKEFSIKAE